MKQVLTPSLADLRLECVLMQAWKKTSAHLRAHSWFADILEIDYESLRIPSFLSEIQEAIDSDASWIPAPLQLVPAPKAQRWRLTQSTGWAPRSAEDRKKIRPLAHVALRDQVVATAIMLCLADRVETQMGDPRLPIENELNRRKVLGYGHRLVCDTNGGGLHHRWGSSKLYRQYFQDYQAFLQRPGRVAESLRSTLSNFDVAIVRTDLSKFYDRVQPDVLRAKLEGLRGSSDDQRFFNLAGRVLHWRWADTTRASRHAEEQQLSGFMDVALPQGLVAAGFFANVVMLDVEERLRSALGQIIDEQLEVTLLDAAYYVDDFRLVVKVPRKEPRCKEDQIRDAVSSWLQEQLNATETGLRVEQSKTTATVEGRDDRFLVPQSRTARRIQSQTSGVFDTLHGTELVGAIEGFFHTQKRYSTETNAQSTDRPNLLVGLSDMRDETAARFAAARFRRTFRSLRPMLAQERQQPEQALEDTYAEVDAESAGQSLVLSKEQLDERAKLFAALLIEEWISNPANVRLLRVALDMYPDRGFLNKVLELLEPGWRQGGARGACREIRLYCLSELFRAGATETGMVHDAECLPHGASVERYHNRLLQEAKSVLDAFTNASRPSTTRLPWYLLQQVLLYLAARDAFPKTGDRLGSRGGHLLALHRRFVRFLIGKPVTALAERARFFVIAQTGFALSRVTERSVAQGVSPEFLSCVDACSPSTAAALWTAARPTASDPLSNRAEQLGLSPKRAAPNQAPSYLPELAVKAENPFLSEPNILYLADWLLALPAKNFASPITPWRIACSLRECDRGGPFGRIKPESLCLRRASGTASQLFEPPDWCETIKEKRRYQIGALLRFAIRGTTDFHAAISPPRRTGVPRYRRSKSHWQQERFSSFHGRSAFGPPWLPISSFVEALLIELLRWPGVGSNNPERSTSELKRDVKERLRELEDESDNFSGALFLTQIAPLPPSRKVAVTHERPLRIGVVQTVTPHLRDYETSKTDLELSSDSAFRRKHRAHLAAVLEGVNQMRRVRESHRNIASGDGSAIDLLVFPELAVHPDDVKPLLLPFARKHRCILLFGMVYHPEPRLGESRLINSCQWLIPEWNKANGLQLKQVEQGKQHLAEAEMKLGSLAPFRPAQWLIDYVWSSDSKQRPLTITASVCYDATDLTLAADLRSRSDLYIVCALNKDVATFDRMAEALHFHMYQGVLVVNNGEFGGSSFFMPFKEHYHRQVFHLHGQPQVAVAFAEICPTKLVNRKSGAIQSIFPIGRGAAHAPPVGQWKWPPAGLT